MDYLCNGLLVDIYMVKAVNSVHRLSNAKMVGHNLYVYIDGMRRGKSEIFCRADADRMYPFIISRHLTSSLDTWLFLNTITTDIGSIRNGSLYSIIQHIIQLRQSMPCCKHAIIYSAPFDL